MLLQFFISLVVLHMLPLRAKMMADFAAARTAAILLSLARVVNGLLIDNVRVYSMAARAAGDLFRVAKAKVLAEVAGSMPMHGLDTAGDQPKMANAMADMMMHLVSQMQQPMMRAPGFCPPIPAARPSGLAQALAGSDDEEEEQEQEEDEQ